MLELERLDTMLREADIPFERLDDNFKISEEYQIKRIKYPRLANEVYSVIQGFGTYGTKANLLEVMDCETNNVEGWLTAEDVFKRIEKHWKEKGGKK